MIVLGLDVSFSATGWVVIQADDDSVDKRPTVLGYARVGPFDTPRNWSAQCGRIKAIVDEVLDAVNHFKPNVIGVEDYSYASVEHAHKIGELHGVLMHYLWRTEQEVDRVPIGTWRKLALGNGQLAKDQVRVEVIKRWGEEFKSLDVTEAYGVAIAAWMRRIGANKPPPKLRRRTQAEELPLVTSDPFA